MLIQSGQSEGESDKKLHELFNQGFLIGGRLRIESVDSRMNTDVVYEGFASQINHAEIGDEYELRVIVMLHDVSGLLVVEIEEGE